MRLHLCRKISDLSRNLTEYPTDALDLYLKDDLPEVKDTAGGMSMKDRNLVLAHVELDRLLRENGDLRKELLAFAQENHALRQYAQVAQREAQPADPRSVN